MTDPLHSGPRVQACDPGICQRQLTALPLVPTVPEEKPRYGVRKIPVEDVNMETNRLS